MLLAIRYAQVPNDDLPVERAKALDDADHRLLGGVVGVVRGADDAPAHGMHTVVVEPQQLVERDPIARLRGGHELGVVGGHRRQAVNVISASLPR